MLTALWLSGQTVFARVANVADKQQNVAAGPFEWQFVAAAVSEEDVAAKVTGLVLDARCWSLR